MHPSYDQTTLIDSSLLAGEVLLSQIYDAVRHGKHWDRTLLIVTFDEHGGLYDHVPAPLGATPPEVDPSYPLDNGFRFDRFGVRVPTLLISPRIAPATVLRAAGPVPFDHTTIIKTICARWGLAGLTNRDKAAPHVGDVFSLTPDQARRDTPTLVPRPYEPVDRQATHHSRLTHLRNDIVQLLAARAATTLPAVRTIGDAIAHLRALLSDVTPSN